MILNINLSDARRIVAIQLHKILNNHVDNEGLSPCILSEIIKKIISVEDTIGKIMIIKLRRTELSRYTAIRSTRLLVLTGEH